MRRLSVLLAALACCAQAGPIAWTVTKNSGAELISFDATTGAVLTTLPFSGTDYSGHTVGGLAFNPANGELLTFVWVGGGANRLVAINLSNGSYSFRSAATDGNNDVVGMTFDGPDVLRYVQASGGGMLLLTYNLATSTFSGGLIPKPNESQYTGCNDYTGLAKVGSTLVTTRKCPDGSGGVELRYFDATTGVELSRGPYPFPTSGTYPGLDNSGGLKGMWITADLKLRIASLNLTTGVGAAGAIIPVNAQGIGVVSLAFQPGATNCDPIPSVTQANFPSSGGSQNLNITADCGWSVSGAPAWLTVTPPSGSNNGTINLQATANPSTSPRSAILTIGSRTIEVTQPGITCSYSLSSPSPTFNANAQSGSVNVITQAGCAWTASSPVSWVTVGTPSGTGSGTVNLTIAANPATQQRQTTLTIAGNSFPLTQQANITVTVSPTSVPLQAGQTQQFTPTVAGAANTAVTWTLPSGTGSISSTGLYTAPATITTPSTATVRATSVADPAKYGEATVNLTPVITVTVTPPTATLQQGQTQTFNATVTGSANTAVTWSLPNGGLGSITSNGQYTAPATITTSQTVTVRAISAADPSRTGDATVTLQPLNCSYSLSANSASFGTGASSGTVDVLTGPNCTWTAASNDGVATITNGHSRSGPGTVQFSVAPNTGGATRIGTLLIAGLTFTITQAGRGCVASLSPSRATLGPAAAIATIALSLNNDCPWTATGGTDWAILTSSRSGRGTDTIRYSVLANPGNTARSATFTIAGVPFSVTQSVGDCSGITISESGQSFADAGGPGSVVVSAPIGCSYSATANDSFLTVPPPATRTGPTTVNFTVQPNNTRQTRQGTLTIAGKTFVVTQAAPLTPTITCTVANVTNPASLRSLGRTELLSDLTLNCSGSSGGVTFTGDILVNLNSNLTNKLLNGSGEGLDARLTITGGGTINGRLEGPNAVRFPGVPLASGGPQVSLEMTISKLRADVTQLGSDQEVRINATVSLVSPVPVPITNGVQTVGISRPALSLNRGSAVDGPGVGQKIVRLVVQETFPTAFRTKDGEAGGSAADTGTRLLLRISNLPLNAQVYAPVASANNGAQLLSADLNGIGGSPVTGSSRAGGSYAQVLLTNGVATAVWEVVSADPQSIDGAEFPILIENASNSDVEQIRMEATLAPVNGTVLASATAPIPRFIDPTAAGRIIDMRIQGKLLGVSGDQRRAPVALGGSSSLAFDISNGSDQEADNVVFRGNLAPGMTPTSCVATRGICTISGNQLRANLGSFATGAQATVTVNASIGGLANCPSCLGTGNLLKSNATVTSDQSDNDVANNASSVDVAVDGGCQFTVSRPTVTAAGTGAAITIDVLTGSLCDWNIPSSDGGIVISPAGAVRGSAMVTITVPANPGAAQRTLSVNIAGQTVSVVQAGSGCAFALTGPSGISAAGGTFQLQVQTSCPWKALGGPDWLTISPPGTGNGSGQVSFSVSANPTLAPRVGFIEVAGQTVAITQPAALGTGPICQISASPATVNIPIGGGPGSVSVTAGSGCPWTATTNDSWITISSGASGSANGTVSISVAANTGVARTGVILIANQQVTVSQSGTPSPGLRFVALAPCRVMETRAEYNFQGRTGSFGPPYLRSGETRSLTLANSNVCQIPATAKAYVLNVTLIPRGVADFVSVWPAAEPRPDFWTVRSPDGQIVANSAIVKTGNGAIQVYSSNDTDMIIDIAGYFTDDAAVSNLVYYPLTPCRVIDTRLDYRTPAGPFGPPQMNARETRNFRFPGNPYCTIPAGAAAYSVTITAVPPAALQYLTAWPAGGSQPNVSNINSPAGRVLANSVILPASSDGSISVFTFDRTDFLVDINGYFAPDNGSTGLYYYPVTQCRVSDSRNAAGTFGGPIFGDQSQRTIPVAASGCTGIASNAKAYAMNATAIPNGNPMPFLTLWPTGQDRPNISVLNAFQGQTVTNSAIIPAGVNGSIEAFTYQRTHVVLEISGYFGR